MSFTAFFKDKNLKPENIRKGVKIGRVKGTLEGGGGGSGNNQNITANSSTLEQIFEAEEGYDGIGVFTLLPYVLQSKTVNSSTNSQTVTFDNGYNGLLSVTVNPYTLDSKTVNSSTVSQTVNSSADGLLSVTVNPYTLDSKTVDSSTVSQTVNSSADGLLSVTVNPYVLDTKSLDPSLNSQTVNSSADGMSSVSISAVTSSIDANIQAENIKSGVTILGVTGNLASGDWVADARKGTLTDLRSKKLDPKNYSYKNLFNYSVDAYRRLPDFTGNSTSVGIGQYMNTFSNSKYWYHNVESGWSQLGSEFPFTYISQNGMKECFMNSWFSYNSTMGSNVYIKFPNLTTIENGALRSAFKNCLGAQKMQFPLLNLTGYSDYGMASCFENFNPSGYYLTLDMPSLTNVTSHALEAVCKNVNMMNLPTFLPNITNISSYGMSESFSNSTSSNNMTGAVNFDNLTSIGAYGLYRAFYNRSGITSVSFNKLTSIGGNEYMMRETFYNCTGITSVSFPELTSIGQTGYRPMEQCFYNCSNITSINFPKLSYFNFYAYYDRDAMFYYSNITTANLHPGCLSGDWGDHNILYSCQNVTDLTITADATNNIHLDWQPSLSFNSILSVLSHLDLNTSGKSCTFYTSGLTVADDLQGSLQTAYDAAVNAGWTINNLTINPSYIIITSPSDGNLDLGTSNTIDFDTASSWTAITSSNDIVLDSYSGSAGLAQSVTVTTSSNWEGNETITFTCNNVNIVVRVYNYNNLTFLTKITTNNDVIDIAKLTTNTTVFSADMQRMSGRGNIVSNNGGTTTFYLYMPRTEYYPTVAVDNKSKSVWGYNDIRYEDLRGGLTTYYSTYGYVFIGYGTTTAYNNSYLNFAATDTPMCAGDSGASFDFYGLKHYENWKNHDSRLDPDAILVHDYKPASKNNVCGFFDNIEKKWYPCRNGLVTGTV